MLLRVQEQDLLRRMTPQNKVSLEQRGEKNIDQKNRAKPQSSFEFKKIQGVLPLDPLLDITPCMFIFIFTYKILVTEILEQRERMERTLKPIQYNEVYQLGASQLRSSKVSRKAENREPSQSRIRSAQSRKSNKFSVHSKKYEKVMARECSLYDPINFSRCLDSAHSSCSCSYCCSQCSQEKVAIIPQKPVHYKSNQSAQSRFQTNSQSQSSQKKTGPSTKPSKPSRSNSNKKAIKVIVSPKSESIKKPILLNQRPQSAQQEKRNVDSTQQFLDNLTNPQKSPVSKPVIRRRSQPIKGSFNFHINITSEDPLQEKLKKLQGFKEKQKLIFQMYSSRLQSQAKQQENQGSFVNLPWRLDQKKVLQFMQQFFIFKIEEAKAKRSILKQKLEQITNSSKVIVRKPSRSRSKGYKTKEEMDKEEQEKKKLTLEKRKTIIAYEPVKKTKAEQERIAKLIEQLKNEKKQKEEQEKLKKQKLMKLKESIKENNTKGNNKPFKPTESQIEKAFVLV